MPRPTAPFRPPQRAAEHRLRGIALRLAGMICFSVMAAVAKLASERGVSAVELIFWRNAFALPLVIGWIAIGPGFSAIRTKRPGAHLVRAVLGLITMVMVFQSIILLPLAEATTIGFAAPLFATLLSAVLLGEHVGRRRWAAVGFGFVGVMLVMRPGGADLPAQGLMIAIASAFGVATVTITVRQIGATESSATTVFWFNMIALIAAGAALPFLGATPHGPMWGLLIPFGLLGGAAQLLTTESLRQAPVSTLAPFDYFQLLGALLLGWLIWNDLPALTTLGGAILIVGSGLYTAWREHRLHREAAPATPPIT